MACRQRKERAGAGRGAVRARRPPAGADEQLPAPVLRRPAPAHRHRPRAGAGAEADRRRRAGLGARRLDPGAGHQPAEGPAARAAALLPLHLAQSRGGRAHQPPHRGDVSRPHRRIRRHALDLHPRPASLHRGAAVGRAGARPGHQAQEAGAAGRRAEPGEAAARLPLPHPLPLRRGALQGRSRRRCAKSRRGITFPAICASPLPAG